MSGRPTSSIAAMLVKTEAAVISASLDEGKPDEVLSDPRFCLMRALRAVDAFRLGPDPGGILLIGDIQKRITALLARLDSCLPCNPHATGTMASARPVLAGIVAEIPELLVDVRKLDAYASPLSMWG